MGWHQEDYNVYFFKSSPPTLEAIIERLHKRTGLLPILGQPEQLLGESFVPVTNPQAERDWFEIYIQADFVRLTTYAQADYLTLATVHTLLDMGGYFADQLPLWPTKRWEEVAEVIKEFAYHTRPDWIWH